MPIRTGGDSFNSDEESKPVWQEIGGQLVAMIVDRARQLAPPWLLPVTTPALVTHLGHRLNYLGAWSRLAAGAFWSWLPAWLSRLLELGDHSPLASLRPSLPFVWIPRRRKPKNRLQGLTLLTPEEPLVKTTGAGKEEFLPVTHPSLLSPLALGEELPELAGELVSQTQIPRNAYPRLSPLGERDYPTVIPVTETPYPLLEAVPLVLTPPLARIMAPIHEPSRRITLAHFIRTMMPAYKATRIQKLNRIKFEAARLQGPKQTEAKDAIASSLEHPHPTPENEVPDRFQSIMAPDLSLLPEFRETVFDSSGHAPETYAAPLWEQPSIISRQMWHPTQPSMFSVSELGSHLGQKSLLQTAKAATTDEVANQDQEPAHFRPECISAQPSEPEVESAPIGFRKLGPTPHLLSLLRKQTEDIELKAAPRLVKPITIKATPTNFEEVSPRPSSVKRPILPHEFTLGSPLVAATTDQEPEVSQPGLTRLPLNRILETPSPELGETNTIGDAGYIMPRRNLTPGYPIIVSNHFSLSTGFQVTPAEIDRSSFEFPAASSGSQPVSPAARSYAPIPNGRYLKAAESNFRYFIDGDVSKLSREEALKTHDSLSPENVAAHRQPAVLPSETFSDRAIDGAHSGESLSSFRYTFDGEASRRSGEEALKTRDSVSPENVAAHRQPAVLPSETFSDRAIDGAHSGESFLAALHGVTPFGRQPVGELALAPIRHTTVSTTETPPKREPRAIVESKEPPAPDIDAIARDVYTILRRRLVRERERTLGIS